MRALASCRDAEGEKWNENGPITCVRVCVAAPRSGDTNSDVRARPFKCIETFCGTFVYFDRPLCHDCTCNGTHSIFRKNMLKVTRKVTTTTTDKKNEQNENKLLENANDTKHTVENVSFCTSLSLRKLNKIFRKKLNNLMSCVPSSLFAVALALTLYLLSDAVWFVVPYSEHDAFRSDIENSFSVWVCIR